MVLGDYIVQEDPRSVVPGKVVDADGNMFVVEWGPDQYGMIPQTAPGYLVVGHGDPDKGWGNKTKP